MNDTISRFDFLAKEFFKARLAGHKIAENYYLIHILSYKESELGVIANKYTRLGQHGSAQHNHAKKQIEDRYCFFFAHSLTMHNEASTQTDDLPELSQSSEVQLIGDDEQTNEDIS